METGEDADGEGEAKFGGLAFEAGNAGRVPPPWRMVSGTFRRETSSKPSTARSNRFMSRDRYCRHAPFEEGDNGQGLARQDQESVTPGIGNGD